VLVDPMRTLEERWNLFAAVNKVFKPFGEPRGSCMRSGPSHGHDPGTEEIVTEGCDVERGSRQAV
jgi:hypothetical protein